MKRVIRSVAYAVLTLVLVATVSAIRSGKATELMEWGEESVRNAFVVSLLFVTTWAPLAGFLALGRKSKK